MLDPAREAHAAKLIETREQTQRAIARQTNVSRGTIGAMVHGRRPLDYSRQQSVKLEHQLGELPEAPPVRCPDCGGLVRMPCGGCRIRRLLAAGMLRKTYPDVPGEEEPLTVALQDEDLERYLQVRHRKEAEMFAEMPAEPVGDQPLDALEPSDEELRGIETDASSGE